VKGRGALCSLLLVASGTLLACNARFRFQDGPDARAAEMRCEHDADCGHASSHCDVVSHRCVACSTDADCAATGAPRCDVALHRCVECGADLDCASGQSCEAITRRCVVTCSEGQVEHVCPATAPTCDEVAGFCVQCQSDSDCVQNTDDGNHCDGANGRCVRCTADQHCPTAQPRCDRTRGRCGECVDPSDCPNGKVCNLSRLQCV
jgi:Cys-rich repeat protein